MVKNVFKKVSKVKSISYYKHIKAIVEENISDFKYPDMTDTFLVSCGYHMTTSSLDDIFWNARELSSSLKEMTRFNTMYFSRRLFYCLSNDNENKFSFIKKEIS